MKIELCQKWMNEAGNLLVEIVKPPKSEDFKLPDEYYHPDFCVIETVPSCPRDIFDSMICPLDKNGDKEEENEGVCKFVMPIKKEVLAKNFFRIF